MDVAVLQIRRHPAGRLEIGPVAVLLVPEHAIGDELGKTLVRGVLAGRDVECGRRVGNVDGLDTCDVTGVDPVRGLHSGVGRLPPSVCLPRTEVGGEHPVGLAVVFANATGRHRVGRSFGA